MTQIMRGYAVALTATLTAFTLRLSLSRWLQDDAPFLVFTTAVMAAALYGGLRPGLLATFLSLGLGQAFFISPLRVGAQNTLSGLVHVVLFFAVGLVISTLSEARRRAEKASRASEEYLRRILETTTSGILVLDQAGYITFANPAAAELFGLMPSHLVGRRHDDDGWGLLSAEGGPLPPGATTLERVWKRGITISDLRLAVQSPNGTPIPLSINASPLRGPDQRITGAVVALNITPDDSRRARRGERR